MSRIGKLPISIVDGVEVTIAEGNYVIVFLTDLLALLLLHSYLQRLSLLRRQQC